MSAVHFSEAVHAGIQHKDSALRRAELMQELCAENILRFPTEVPKLELQKALGGAATSRLCESDLASPKGKWFGFCTNLDNLTEARREVSASIEKLLAPLPRRERRRLKADLDLRKKSAHTKWREIIGSAPETDEFPTNLVGPESTIAWFLREMSDAEYRERTISIMHDPLLMFKYILDETKNRRTLYELIRNQGTALLSDLEKSEELMRPALAAIAFSSAEINLRQLIDRICLEPPFLRQTIAAYSDIDCNIPDGDLRKITESCPSLSSQIAASKSYLLQRAYSLISRIRGGNNEASKAKPSDLGDLMHSFYAPYFDIFRCDARFGEILKRHPPIRERIVDRLSDLPHRLAPLAATAAQVSAAAPGTSL